MSEAELMPSDEATLRAMYVAWNEGGPRAASEYWAEDVQVHDFPEMPDASVTRGRRQTLRLWEERFEAFRVKLELISIEEIDPGLFLAALEIVAQGADTGISLNEVHHHVIRMRDSLAVEAKFFRELSQAREAAGLPPE